MNPGLWPSPLRCVCAATPESCLLTEARVLSIATVFGLTIGILVYASASFSGVCQTPQALMP